MKLVYFKIILTINLLTVYTQTTFGTTLDVAYPYTQQIEGQNVVVKAFPFEPYSGSPMIGVTNVYSKNKLIYSIDKYYREKLFTSNDGKYFVIVHTSNYMENFGHSPLNRESIINHVVFEIFKNGKPFKEFTIKDLFDTSKLSHNGNIFYWDYFVDLEKFKNAENGCKSCKNTYSIKDLHSSEIPKINFNEWKNCKRKCDSAEFKTTAIRLSENSIYVQGNSLFLLTNMDKVIKLDFTTLNIEQYPFQSILQNLENFNPLNVNRRFIKVNYPLSSLLPNLENGKTINQGIAELLNKKVSKGEKDSVEIEIYIKTLLINKEGKCELANVYANILSVSKYDTMNFESEIVFKKEIENWIYQQRFKTKTIPKGFQKFNFSFFVFLKP